ncbi:MAG: hypothetical protein QOD99_1438 [Chthoniobacter sp.]|jgi:rhodanese-related sulfurtransferase|nr:hypothetical protein [Chthoniobacter sp.]
MRIARQALVIALIALVPAGVAAWVHRGLFADSEISLATAQRLRGALWIDARAAEDYEKAHVPDAYPLNEDEWSALLPPVLQAWAPGQTAVVYCSSQSCQASRAIAARLREFKLGPVFVLRGGWESWNESTAAKKK